MEKVQKTLWIVYDHEGAGVADFDRDEAISRYENDVGNVEISYCYIKAVKINAPLPLAPDDVEAEAPTVDLPHDPAQVEAS